MEPIQFKALRYRGYALTTFDGEAWAGTQCVESWRRNSGSYEGVGCACKVWSLVPCNDVGGEYLLYLLVEVLGGVMVKPKTFAKDDAKEDKQSYDYTSGCRFPDVFAPLEHWSPLF